MGARGARRGGRQRQHTQTGTQDALVHTMTGLVALERHVIRSRSFLRKPSSVPTEFDEFCQELRTQIFKQYFGLLCGCTAHLPYNPKSSHDFTSGSQAQGGRESKSPSRQPNTHTHTTGAHVRGQRHHRPTEWREPLLCACPAAAAGNTGVNFALFEQPWRNCTQHTQGRHTMTRKAACHLR
jgi:hypothetical protein